MSAALEEDAVRPTTPAPPVSRVTVFMHAGQYFASSEPCEISTVLGSCVAVCVYDRGLRVGGANHFLLPHQPEGVPASPRFGAIAVAALVARMATLGSQRQNMEAKIFGGASLIPIAGKREVDSLGWKNVEAARQALAEAGVRVVAEDVGGTSGRRVVFRTDEGHAWIKRL